MKRQIALLISMSILIVMALPACTPQNEVGHFYPREDSVLNIEFDYPEDWGLLEEVDIRASSLETFHGGLLSIRNPRMAEKPCTGDQNCVDTRETIGFRVWTVRALDDWAEKETSESLERIARVQRFQLVENKLVVIDGIPARMLTKFSEGDEYGGIEGYSVSVFLLRNGMGYEFFMSFLRPGQLNGAFYQDFLEILTTIKFVDR